jgi:hypothetical protein
MNTQAQLFPAAWGKRHFGMTELMSACRLVGGIAATVACASALAAGAAGTAKPPGGGGGGGTAISFTPLDGNIPAIPPVAGAVSVIPAAPILQAPTFSLTASANFSNLNGFDIVGYIQDVKVSNAECPGLPAAQAGGTLLVNGLTIDVPCNTVLQFPANTVSWAQAVSTTLVDPATGAAQRSLLLGAAPAAGQVANVNKYSQTEVHVVGNNVNGKNVAGLIFISQQSLASGAGYILSIDYVNHALIVGDVQKNALGAITSSTPRLQIKLNDPNGRFGAAGSADSRFSVDDTNPTIHAGSGYPMCIPRVTPPAAGANETDLLCPQKNRPLVAHGCRNLTQAFVATANRTGISAFPKAAVDFTPPLPGQTYCAAFVMTDPPKVPQSTKSNDPTDSRQQAPFEVGDYIKYSGTFISPDATGPVDPISGLKTDTLWAHTIEASVGIFTNPGSFPTYVALGDFEVAADVGLTSLAGVPQEVANRLVVEGMITDVTDVVDFYFVDVDPATGQETNRWLTPEDMTGTVTSNPAPIQGMTTVYGQPFGGGIVTQLFGAQPGRARMRATKATPGILTNPSRNIRMVARRVCAPDTFATGYAPTNAKPLFLGTKATFQGINTIVAQESTGLPVPCVQREPVANGLYGGVYTAPTFAYIFAENLVAGDPIVPNDFWAYGFLVTGDTRSGGLTPAPY